MAQKSKPCIVQFFKTLAKPCSWYLFSWELSFQVPDPFLNGSFFFDCLVFLPFFYVMLINLCLMYIWKTSPLHGLLLHSTVSLAVQTSFSFMRSHLSIVSFNSWVNEALLRKSLPTLIPCVVMSMFSSNSFRIQFLNSGLWFNWS